MGTRFATDAKSKGIISCIPRRDNRKKPIRYNKKLYKKRNKIERTFSRIKDWRRVAARYDRCPEMLLSACALSVIVNL